MSSFSSPTSSSFSLPLPPYSFSSSQDPSVKDDILLEVINLCGTFSLDEKCAALLVQARLPDLLVTLLKGTHITHTQPSSPHTLLSSHLTPPCPLPYPPPLTPSPCPPPIPSSPHTLPHALSPYPPPLTLSPMPFPHTLLSSHPPPLTPSSSCLFTMTLVF